MSANETLQKTSVSVLIAFYNGMEFIGDTLKSISAQTVRPDEVILVDDCSSTIDLDFIRQTFAEESLRIFRHEANLGLAATRNSCVKYSSGDLLLPLDQDDILEQQFIEKTAAVLQDPTVDGAYSYVQLFGERDDLWCPEMTMLNLMTGTRCSSSILFRRELFDRAGGFNVTVRSPDTDFWLRALACGVNLRQVQEPLLRYRKHMNSLSERTKHDEISELVACNSDLYGQNVVEVIKHYEASINKQKQEYLTLEEGFKNLEEGYFELLARYDKTVEALNKLSLRRWLCKMLGIGTG
jgi:glycosyltransferase involved in cell wall biosynthesis